MVGNFGGGEILGGKTKLFLKKRVPNWIRRHPVTNANASPLDQARDAVSVVRARLGPGAAPRLPATAAEEWRPPPWRRSTRRVLEQIHEHDGSALLVRDGPPARAPVTEERQRIHERRTGGSHEVLPGAGEALRPPTQVDGSAKVSSGGGGGCGGPPRVDAPRRLLPQPGREPLVRGNCVSPSLSDSPQ